MKVEGNTTLKTRLPTMMKQRLTKPIFIVGLPRTGSKLLMNMINNNLAADCHIANEVQFFGHSTLGRILQGRRGIMPIIDAERNENGKVEWGRVIDKLYSGEAKGVYWNGLSAGWLHIPRNKLLEALSGTDGTPRAVYEAILVTQEKKYSLYGDKSGPNLYFVSKLLQYFPDAKILHIIRDPRAIVTSQRKRLLSILQYKSRSSPVITRIKQVLLGPLVVLYILTYWGYAVRINRRLSKARPDSYMLVRFEDLVAAPEETAKKICRFLSIPWDEGMTSPPKRDSSYIDPDDVKKTVDRGRGMDRDAINRWRHYIPPWVALAVRVYGSVFYPGALEEFGYSDSRDQGVEAAS
jgi:Sulfotransferase family